MPREAAVRDVTPKLGLEAQESGGSSRGLWIGLGLVALVALGVGGWWMLGRPSSAASSTATTTVPAEVLAARARVKELEDRIAQMERERAEAEAKAAEDARQNVEAQAAAKGKVVDPAALQKAQEEARQRARAEQERRQQEELTRLAAARRAEEKKIAEASPSPPPPTPTPEPVAAAAAPTLEPTVPAAMPPATVAAAPTPPTTAPASHTASEPGGAEPTTPGMTVDVSDPRLVRPVLVSKAAARYPMAAEKMRASGRVELLALVDESGRVVEAKVTKVQPERMGFDIEAERHVRSMKYRPGTRDGIPVKVRLPVVVTFTPAR